MQGLLASAAAPGVAFAGIAIHSGVSDRAECCVSSQAHEWSVDWLGPRSSEAKLRSGRETTAESERVLRQQNRYLESLLEISPTGNRHARS